MLVSVRVFVCLLRERSALESGEGIIVYQLVQYHGIYLVGKANAGPGLRLEERFAGSHCEKVTCVLRTRRRTVSDTRYRYTYLVRGTPGYI